MTTEQFTYWLQGFFEISDAKELKAKEVKIIKDHLNLVFNKVTPDRHQSSTSGGGFLDKLNKKPSIPLGLQSQGDSTTVVMC